MTTRVYTDRSRILTFQRCNRRRFWEYHAGPERAGVVPVAKALPLAVGGAVHSGLAVLLRACMDYEINIIDVEDKAVAAALADFAEYAGKLDLDLAERAALEVRTGMTLGEQLQASLPAPMVLDPLDMAPEDTVAGAGRPVGDAKAEFDAYLYREQRSLVEGLVRAYARRRLRPLLEQYEVLEVEREGSWLLSQWGLTPEGFVKTPVEYGYELMFMSRPDALLRDRESNQLYLLSFKTAAGWDIRKARDAERDMQGLSEGIEVERRLARWYDDLGETMEQDYETWAWGKDGATRAMYEYLKTQSQPPRILGVRMEYLLKGDRWVDKDLTRTLGMEVRTQRSPLVRQYVCVSTPSRGKSSGAFNLGDVCWSWDYHREDGATGSLAWQNWKSKPVTDAGTVKDWIDALDATTEVMSAYDSTTGFEPRAVGWKGPAQALGYTSQHPLDSVFVPPMIVYRNEDDLRDLVETMEAMERANAEHAAEVHACEDEGQRRSLLNIYYPMNRQSCEYPSTCPYVPLCYGGEDIRRDPLASGRYAVREPNHPQEKETAHVHTS